MIDLIPGSLPLLCAVPAARALARRLDASRALETTLAWTWILTFQGTVLGLTSAATPTGVVASSVLIALAGGLALRGTRERSKPPRSPDSLRGIVVAGVALVVVPGLWFTLTVPVTNYDSLAYHLPMLAAWTRSASLTPPEWIGVQRCFPMSLLATSLPSTVLARHDIFASLVAFVGFPLWGLSVHRLSREWGASLPHAAIGGMVAMGLPLVVRSAGSIQPDLLLGALVVAATAGAVSFARRPSRRGLALLGLSLSLVPGTKPSGSVYVAIVVVFLVLRSRHANGRAFVQQEISHATGWIAIVGFVALALAWPLRSIVACASGAPDGFFVGPGDPSSEWSAAELFRTTVLGAFRPTESADWSMIANVMTTSLGPPFLVLVGLALWASVSRKTGARRVGPGPKERWTDRRRCTIALLAVALAFTYAATPFSADNGLQGWRLSPWSHVSARYALPFVGVIAALTIATLRRVRQGTWILATAGFVGGGLSLVRTLELAPADVAMSALLAILAASTSVAASRYRTLSFVVPWIGVALALLAFFVAADRRDALRDVAYGPFFASVQEIVHANAPIASFGIDRPYPLYGVRMERDVVGRGRPRHDRGLWQSDRDAWTAHTRAWVHGLEDRGVHHLVVRSRDPRPDVDGRSSALAALLEQHPSWSLRLDSEDASSLMLFEFRTEIRR